MVQFSLIIPTYNEQEVLPKLFGAVTDALSSWVQGDWEVIFVDDGSRDNSAAPVASQNQNDPRFKGLRLSRNFGHQAAVSTGLAYASGRYIGVVDADLQDPMEVLCILYKACSERAFNIAYGVRKKRDAPFFLDLCYKSFYRFMNRFSDHPGRSTRAIFA
jgi:polyisoprenyl-phosphate glycosyltransferase